LSKNNNIEQFDNLFKENLGDASVEAPSGVWGNVSSQVGSGASSVGTTSTVIGKSILIKTVAAIVVVAVATVGIVKLVPEDNKVVPIKNVVTLENNTEALETKESLNTIEEDKEPIFKEEDVVKENTKLAVANNENTSNQGTEENNSTSDSKINGTEEDKGGTEKLVAADNRGVTGADGLNQEEIKEILTKDLNTQLKDFYCIGEELYVSMPGAVYAQWFINGSKVSEGGSLDYTFTRTGAMKLEVKSREGVLSSALLNVKGPNTNFNSSEISDGVFVLNPTEKGASYTWNFNNFKGYQSTNESNFVVKDYIRANIPVTLIVRTGEGCIDSIKQNVPNKFVLNGDNPTMANAFTPGTNGYNDKFVVDIKYETYFNFVVKNKKGEVVFNSQDKNIHWDGKCDYTDCPIGLYTYNLIYKIEGSDELRFKNGTITLFKE
jgi:hypothetical protein